MVKNPPAIAGDASDTGPIPGLGMSPREGNGKTLQYSCLENSVDREAWWTTVHVVTESDTSVCVMYPEVGPRLRIHILFPLFTLCIK